MTEGILFFALVIFIIASYIIKFILKKHGHNISLFNDHHKDPIAFLKLLSTNLSWYKKSVYIILFCIYLMSLIIFIINLLDNIGSQ